MHASTIASLATREIDRHETIGILVSAFRDDPAVRSLYPTDLEYARYFPGFVAAFGGKAFDAGTVDVDPERNGAALWFPPGCEPDRETITNHLEVSLPARRLGALAAGLEVQARIRPTVPHWYLPWMGVVPEAQRMGIGSTLLWEGLALADAEQSPVYLEATSRPGAAFFARHGFEVWARISLPHYPEITAMWRPARQVPEAPPAYLSS